ncbi:hypothetical protein, partial [Planococcus sp. ISL-110]|uniref:hypothetical protein n=1 Tax=Planococcus sp. ISL-110 TaxID=2819167 RepID=UPI001BE6E1EF
SVHLERFVYPLAFCTFFYGHDSEAFTLTTYYLKKPKERAEGGDSWGNSEVAKSTRAAKPELVRRKPPRKASTWSDFSAHSHFVLSFMDESFHIPLIK